MSHEYMKKALSELKKEMLKHMKSKFKNNDEASIEVKVEKELPKEEVSEEKDDVLDEYMKHMKRKKAMEEETGFMGLRPLFRKEGEPRKSPGKSLFSKEPESKKKKK